jgi:transcription elongation factor GreA-like protein
MMQNFISRFIEKIIDGIKERKINATISEIRKKDPDLAKDVDELINSWEDIQKRTDNE